MCRSILEGGRRCPCSGGVAGNVARRARYAAAKGTPVQRYHREPAGASSSGASPYTRKTEAAWLREHFHALKVHPDPLMHLEGDALERVL